jgi:hypothetical protein
MENTRLEYIGFAVNETTREYRLRAKQPGGEYQAFTLAISNEAFLAHRVRYQDAPDICFLKLQRELIACSDTLPARHHDVTDAELEDYRVAHAPKQNKNRPKAPFGS